MPMTADMGDCLFTAMEIENTALAAPGYYAGMGFGVPAGIGVAAATGERPLILVGDGAFQMTGWELGNCRRYGLDPIVVLFNNCSWEMLRVFQPESKFNDLSDWNFAAIAPSLGGHGERVTTRRELRDALEAAVARRGHVLAGRGDAEARRDLAHAGSASSPASRRRGSGWSRAERLTPHRPHAIDHELHRERGEDHAQQPFQHDIAGDAEQLRDPPAEQERDQASQHRARSPRAGRQAEPDRPGRGRPAGSPP